MKLKPTKANMTELEVGNITILFSYKTPVACYIEDKGYYRTEKKWSMTTTRHINQWLADNCPAIQDYAIERPQEWFDNLTKDGPND